MKVKEESGKSWLKNQRSKNNDRGIRSHHFMENRWGNSGNSDGLYFLDPESLKDGDWSNEIKRRLLLGRKAMTNLDSILKKKRHYFANKGLYTQSYYFSSSHVQMWGVDHKEGQAPTTDAFELWCWRRLLIVPWTARRSNQSTLKEINPDYSLEGLMLKLKLQYFGHLMRRVNSLEKKPWWWERLKARGEGDDRG